MRHKQEVKCLVRELLLELPMRLVLLAVHNEIIRVTARDPAQLTPDSVASVRSLSVPLDVATLVATLLLLSPLIVELALKFKRFDVLRLPQTAVPLLTHTVREHQEHLTDVCQEVLLRFDNAYDVPFATLTESEIVWLLALSLEHRGFLLVHVKVELNKLSILAVPGTQGIHLFDLLKGAEDTLTEMKVVRHVVHGLQGCQVRLTSVTHDHGVSQSDLFALKLHAIDQQSLLNDALVELLKHVADKLIVQVDLPLDLLDIDRLQEVPFFTVLFVAMLQIFHDLSISRHVDIFESSVLLCVSTIVEEEVLLFFLDLLQSFQKLLGVI